LLFSFARSRTAAGLLAAVAVTCPALADVACVSQNHGRFDVGAVIDGRTFNLADGREVLLAGIEVPATEAAAASLRSLLAGGHVILRPVEEGDRYGRLIGHAFVAKDGRERWIQRDLLATGAAQVGNRPGNAACAKALLAAEATARRGRLGLWADSSYRITASDDLTGLLSRRGRFTVAEGKVLSVRESGGTIYVNFGRVWSRNLTVTIFRRNMRAFEAAGMDPKRLQGVRVRVRGFIEERGGPRMEAARPEQIEIAARE